MKRNLCRVCSGMLELVLDLGVQALGGQFPLIGEPDPPGAPIRLCRCTSCGLAQLDYTVPAGLMFRSYGYRSGVTQTMRTHLKQLAEEADAMSNAKVLDIGGNDGTLLSYLPTSVNKLVIDPADVPLNADNVTHCKGFFPVDMPPEWINFDLIFTVACFYDADDPVAFAKAVAERLAPNGVWCVEVADARRMVQDGGWDAICHEHLCYYEPATFEEVCRQARLQIIHYTENDCNGGSIRFYVRRVGARKQAAYGVPLSLEDWKAFAAKAAWSAQEISNFLADNEGKEIHLLGASTKANTWLQAVAQFPTRIHRASDRDPRKHGHVTPGTGILIISEEESRAMKPDIYIVGPWHFEREIVDREQGFLKRGGRLVFPLPRLHEVSNP
jgi:hypothetical protein